MQELVNAPPLITPEGAKPPEKPLPNRNDIAPIFRGYSQHVSSEIIRMLRTFGHKNLTSLFEAATDNPHNVPRVSLDDYNNVAELYQREADYLRDLNAPRYGWLAPLSNLDEGILPGDHDGNNYEVQAWPYGDIVTRAQWGSIAWRERNGKWSGYQNDTLVYQGTEPVLFCPNGLIVGEDATALSFTHGKQLLFDSGQTFNTFSLVNGPHGKMGIGGSRPFYHPQSGYIITQDQEMKGDRTRNIVLLWDPLTGEKKGEFAQGRIIKVLSNGTILSESENTNGWNPAVLWGLNPEDPDVPTGARILNNIYSNLTEKDVVETPDGKIAFITQTADNNPLYYIQVVDPITEDRFTSMSFMPGEKHSPIKIDAFGNIVFLNKKFGKYVISTFDLKTRKERNDVCPGLPDHPTGLCITGQGRVVVTDSENKVHIYQ